MQMHDKSLKRIVRLEGAVNFRDMGGCLTEDGYQVKSGLLFRSDQLTALTGQDLEIIRKLQLRTILDYRGEAEAHSHPTPIMEGVHYRRIEAIALAARTGTDVGDRTLLDRLLDRDTMINMYARLPFANPAYRFLMEAMGDPQRQALLHHCAGGKDRTGIGAALMLKLLGVSDEDILEDYLLTNEMLGPKAQFLYERYCETMTPTQQEWFRDTFYASEDYLAAAWVAVLGRYESWDHYFAAEFNIDASVRERIRSMYLE